MGTIPSLANAPLPLAGTERLPIDNGATTFDVAVSEVANLGALYVNTDLGAAPDRLDATATYFTTTGDGDPKVVWFPPPVATVTGFGFAALFTGFGSLFTRRAVAALPTRVWEVVAVVEQVSVGAGESPIARVGVHSLKLGYIDTSVAPEVFGPASTVLAAGDVVTLTYRFAAAALDGGSAWADPTLVQLLRPLVRVNERSDLAGSSQASVARVRSLSVRDVTSLASAEDDAFAWSLVYGTAL